MPEIDWTDAHLDVELPIKFVNRVQKWESEDRSPTMKPDAKLRRLYCPECEKVQCHKVYTDGRTFCTKCWHEGELVLKENYNVR